MKKTFIIAFFLLAAGSSSAQTQITFYTTMGKFVVEMFDTITPITSGNFIALANQRFYDGVIFHRVIDKFMIQGGDPTGTGYGGPGYTIPDEFDSRARNLQKTISMANSGPNTGGSQFFINLVNNTYLDSKHAVFGKVIDSFQVVQAIGKVATNPSDRPLTDVVMDSLRVTFSPFTGITETRDGFAISIYPNPAATQVNISSKETINNIVLMDITGRVIKTITTLQNEQHNFTLHLPHDISNGIYYLKLQTGKGNIVRKVAVMKQ